jgi:outer membrane protein
VFYFKFNKGKKVKSLSLILNVVLFIAVGILFYFHFSEDKGVEVKELEAQELATGDIKIAYINADTVLKHYDFFKKKQSELEEKQKKMDQDYRNRAEGFQSEVNNYQQNISNLTIGQAKALEEDLAKKQQNLRMYQERLTQELLKEEGKINEELYNRVTSFIKEYSLKNDIEVVVKYNQGSDILYAGDAMDITWKIVEGLNSKYQQDAGSKEKAK